MDHSTAEHASASITDNAGTTVPAESKSKTRVARKNVYAFTIRGYLTVDANNPDSFAAAAKQVQDAATALRTEDGLVKVEGNFTRA